MKTKLLSLSFLFLGLSSLQAQEELPFHIDSSKRLPEFELSEKKEGTFVTGLPRIEFDPIRGFGFGANLNVFFNKTREDPFFDYTPYRHRLNAEIIYFLNGRLGYALNYDAPYIFNSKWRLRADLVNWEDPNVQYWGIGRESLNALSFRDKKTGQRRSFSRMAAYEQNLAQAELGDDGLYYTDYHYHHMQQRQQLYNLLGERILLGGRLRFMFGYEALLNAFQSYQGQRAQLAYDAAGNEIEAINNETLVDKQLSAGIWEQFNLAGFNNSRRFQFTSMLAFALIYDTRDFEPDPSKGVFLQYSHEYSAPWLGSQFDFNKFMIQGQFVHTFLKWRDGKSRLTFAGLAALGHIFGPRINFIEMWDLSSQAEAGGIMVLGGARSVRGFREARFLAPTVTLVNLELRSRFYDFHFFKQHFVLGATAFFDCGSVFNRIRDINFHRWVGSPGLGLRLNWNESTVLRLDFALSSEGEQVFFGFNHIF